MPKSPELSKIVLLANTWWEAFRNQRLIVKQIIIFAREDADTPELHEILMQLAPSDYPGQISPNKLSHYLRSIADIPILIDERRYWFTSRGTDDLGRQIWQLYPASALTPTPAPTPTPTLAPTSAPTTIINVVEPELIMDERLP